MMRVPDRVGCTGWSRRLRLQYGCSLFSFRKMISATKKDPASRVVAGQGESFGKQAECKAS